VCHRYADTDLRGHRQALYPAEVLSYEMRAKGLAFLGIVTQLAGLINTFGCVTADMCIKFTSFDSNAVFLWHFKESNGKACIRLAIDRAHHHLIPAVYIIFCVWDAFEVIIIYFFVVETKGFTLEEINEIFEQANPPAYSQHLIKQREHRKGIVGVGTVSSS
jgi:Sugar (and other) transporter